MKPGDKVKVKAKQDIAAICTRRNALGELQHESEVTFAATMERLCGQEVTIHSVKEGDWGTFYAIEGSSYAWYDWMFEEPLKGCMKRSMPKEIHLMSYRDLDEGKHMLGFNGGYLRAGDVLIPKPSSPSIIDEMPQFVIESEPFIIKENEWGYVGVLIATEKTYLTGYLQEGVPWIKKCSMTKDIFDKTVHCIPQDVFEYPEDKLYMSQLLSSLISKLNDKIEKYKSNLSMLEKRRNAYREMQSKL